MFKTSENLIYWKAKWGQDSWETDSAMFTDISKPCRVIYFLEGKEKYSTQKLVSYLSEIAWVWKIYNYKNIFIYLFLRNFTSRVKKDTLF